MKEAYLVIALYILVMAMLVVDIWLATGLKPRLKKGPHGKPQ